MYVLQHAPYRLEIFTSVGGSWVMEYPTEYCVKNAVLMVQTLNGAHGESAKDDPVGYSFTVDNRGVRIITPEKTAWKLRGYNTEDVLDGIEMVRRLNAV